jgi:hypothetical protein
MTKKLSGRAAFILAVGLLMGAAHPSFAGPQDAQPDNAAVTAQGNPVGNPAGIPAIPQAAPAAETAGPDQGAGAAAPADDLRQPVVVTQQQAEAPPAPRANPVVAGSQNATWDETSLIGKIFIGFGALLTIASAARMFMA